jgi:hypothetical protein
MNGNEGSLRNGWWLAVAGLCLIVGGWRDANAQAKLGARSPIPLELNKLESLPVTGGSPGGAQSSRPGCRIYFVVINPDPEPISQLGLDLVLFGTDGIVSRRVSFNLGPLAAHKTSVRAFDIEGQRCDGISSVLINDVLTCSAGPSTDPNQQRQACLDRLQLSSRAKAELTK